MKQNIFAGLVACTFLMAGVTTPIFASTPDSPVVSITTAQKQASEYLDLQKQHADTDDWDSAVIQEGKVLYDFDGNVSAYLFPLTVNDRPSGYMIVSAYSQTSGVIESTRTGTTPYVGINGKDAIYVGPLMHYKKVGDAHFEDLHLKKKIQKNTLKSKGPLAKENVNRLSASQITPEAITEYKSKTLTGIPDYQWYKGCAPTSGANIVKYWDNNGYPNLVQDTTQPNTIIEYLAMYMNTNSEGGTTVYNMISGMKQYWNLRGYYPTITDHYSNFGSHVTEMTNSRPDWVTTVSHPTYKDHAMTGVGYESYYSTDDFKYHYNVVVHDTWDTTPVNVWLAWNTLWFDHVISVKQP
ncbi:hypothetical protein CIG75_02290 [Tumebacillus algifaecis]|uniref:Peptidase C39-like domain-containing protein n=1 Tax=Tumebacillus algifaecis TaxID=1214604 RepID=A0A223CX38_9BACL|nr:hypothetical protein [Tumebacillus algifaecis]ASS73920.1 hypothetical protein CIG75_02290 [Tumebacillus algifaecis]